jgi:hypothetical protein
MHFVRERRAVERTELRRGGLLIIPGLRGVFSCGIRDWNRYGAGLRLTGTNLLPADFGLSLDGVRHTFTCRLIWRDGGFAGLVFHQQ